MAFQNFARGLGTGLEEQITAPENLMRMQRSFEKGLGTYDPVDDPMYWQQLEAVQANPTDANISSFIENYGEFLGGDDYQTLLRPSESTLAGQEYNVAKQAAEHDQTLLGHEADITPDRYATEEAQLQAQRTGAGLENKFNLTYGPHVQDLVGADVRQTVAQADIVETERDYTEESILMNLATQGAQLDGIEINNALKELDLEFQEETNPERIQLFFNEADEIRNQIRHNEKMRPIEKMQALTNLAAMETQLRFDKATLEDRIEQVGLQTGITQEQLNAIQTENKYLDQMLQTQLTGQQLANVGQVINNQRQSFELERGRKMLPGELALLEHNVKSSALGNQAQALDNLFNASTLDDRVDLFSLELENLGMQNEMMGYELDEARLRNDFIQEHGLPELMTGTDEQDLPDGLSWNNFYGTAPDGRPVFHTSQGGLIAWDPESGMENWANQPVTKQEDMTVDLGYIAYMNHNIPNNLAEEWAGDMVPLDEARRMVELYSTSKDMVDFIRTDITGQYMEKRGIENPDYQSYAKQYLGQETTQPQTIPGQQGGGQETFPDNAGAARQAAQAYFDYYEDTPNWQILQSVGQAVHDEEFNQQIQEAFGVTAEELFNEMMNLKQ